MTPADLLAARRSLGLTQRALAERLGVSQATLWRWETGAMTIQHPAILALALERLQQTPAPAVWRFLRLESTRRGVTVARLIEEYTCLAVGEAEMRRLGIEPKRG